MPDNLEYALGREFQRAVNICINQYGYRPSYFLQMLDNYGPIDTAIRLVTASKLHEGFTRLWELRRLDLTVEAIILDDPYNQLFAEEVLERAKERLEELGYEEKN
jgi:hypothetical protein